MKTIDIVIPLYNEEENLSKLYQAVSEQKVEGVDFNFIFVNDGSTDLSAEKLEELASKHSNVFYLEFSRNFGHQAALTAGLKHSKGDAAITMDADLQHPPKLIPKMIEYWKQGFEVVYTVRNYKVETSIWKRLTSRLYYTIINKLSNLSIPHGAADFRLWDKKVLEKFQPISEKGVFLRGLSSWMGFKQVGISYESEKRLTGKSKYNFKKMIILALDGITSFSSFPLYISAFVGILFFIVGAIWAGHVVYVKIFTQEAIQGWASIMILIILIGSIQIFLLGIIGVYLAKIHEQIKNRPDYIIKKKKLYHAEA